MGVTGILMGGMHMGFGVVRLGNKIYDCSIKANREKIRVDADISGVGTQRFEVMFNMDDDPDVGDIFILALKGGHEGRFIVRKVDSTAKRGLCFGEIERKELIP